MEYRLSAQQESDIQLVLATPNGFLPSDKFLKKVLAVVQRIAETAHEDGRRETVERALQTVRQSIMQADGWARWSDIKPKLRALAPSQVKEAPSELPSFWEEKIRVEAVLPICEEWEKGMRETAKVLNGGEYEKVITHTLMPLVTGSAIRAFRIYARKLLTEALATQSSDAAEQEIEKIKIQLEEHKIACQIYSVFRECPRTKLLDRRLTELRQASVRSTERKA